MESIQGMASSQSKTAGLLGLEQQIASLKSQLEQAKSENQLVTQLVQFLEKDLTEVRNEKNQVRQRLVVRNNKVDELHQKLEAANCSIQVLQEKETILTKENNDLKRQREKFVRWWAMFPAQQMGNASEDVAAAANLDRPENGCKTPGLSVPQIPRSKDRSIQEKPWNALLV